jgi:hypothetical protein
MERCCPVESMLSSGDREQHRYRDKKVGLSFESPTELQSAWYLHTVVE